jgi:hypothetical protein
VKSGSSNIKLGHQTEQAAPAGCCHLSSGLTRQQSGLLKSTLERSLRQATGIPVLSHFGAALGSADGPMLNIKLSLGRAGVSFLFATINSMPD